MARIQTTGNERADTATAEIAVALRRAEPGQRDQHYYDEAMRLRDEIMSAGATVPAPPAGAVDVTVPPHGAFEARPSADTVKTELELTCTRCGQVTCDIEAGDDLTILVAVADSHTCTVPESGQPEGRTEHEPG